MKTYPVSKSTILLQTNCNEIYIKFLGLSEFPKNNISSPFSDDKKPSFKVYQNGTFKCNSSTKQGDVWQFVAYLNNIDVKTQFKEVLNIVAKEMNLLQYNCNDIANVLQDNCNNKTYKNSIENPTNNVATTVLQDNCNDIATNLKPQNNEIAELKKLNIVERKYTSADIAYWQNLGVNVSFLIIYKCVAVHGYCFTGRNMFNTKSGAVAFAYKLDNQLKIYVPAQPKFNVTKNVMPQFKTGIFGLEQLGTEKKENIIICEGEKDVIVATSRGFNAVTFGSATNFVKKENIELLQSKCNNLFICYDADEPGTNGMQNTAKYNPDVIPIYLPNNNNIKGFDVTDYFQEYNAQDFFNLMQFSLTTKKNQNESRK